MSSIAPPTPSAGRPEAGPTPAKRPPAGSSSFAAHLKKGPPDRLQVPPRAGPMVWSELAGPAARGSVAPVSAVSSRAEAGVDVPRPRFDTDGESLSGLPPVIDPVMQNLLGVHGRAIGPVAFVMPAAVHEVPAMPASAVSLEHLMTRLVRRVAWSGDAHSGSARLEVGAGSLEGATLTIHADAGVLRVALDLPPGVDRAEWRERIARRLDARGLQLAELDVD